MNIVGVLELYVTVGILSLIVRIIVGLIRTLNNYESPLYTMDDEPPSLIQLPFIVLQWPRPKFWKRWDEGEWDRFV